MGRDSNPTGAHAPLKQTESLWRRTSLWIVLQVKLVQAVGEGNEPKCSGLTLGSAQLSHKAHFVSCGKSHLYSQPPSHTCEDTMGLVELLQRRTGYKCCAR